jgi:phytoene dehydrogenase-like protein
LCDRHFGGINYPVGGVGGIALSLADGLVEKGSEIRYKANVTNVVLENGKAVSYLTDLNTWTYWVLYLSCELLYSRLG